MLINPWPVSSYKMSTYFAKTDPPYLLEAHSNDVAERGKRYFQNIPQNRLENAPVFECLERMAWLTGFMHDIGKSNPQWQEWAKNRIEGKESNVRKPNHSAVSAAIARSVLDSEKYKLSEQQKDAIFLAILHHHTAWTPSNMRPESQLEGEAINKHLSQTMDNLPDFYASPEQSVDRTLQQADYIRKEAELNSNDDNWNKLRRTALFLYSALRQADWHESAKASGESGTFAETLDVNILNGFSRKRHFQKKISKKSDATHLIGLAGCGEGKTYSALLWGAKQVEHNNANRVVFAMPTQVTTNNLAQNMAEQTVPPESVSLYHGETDFLSLANEDAIPDIGKAELYQAPVNVTTVDHLIDTFVSNYEEAPISFVNLFSSAVVFDEIQAYDSDTVQDIIACAKRCERLGIPTYTVSATIPNSIRREMPASEQIVSEGILDGEKREPFTVEVKRKELTAEEVSSEISQDLDKVMVVKNTVREAQQVADTLRKENYDVYYYSSEFSQADRDKKERQIKSEFATGERSDGLPKILVCTQICEISLDLSSDLLLTDIAPIDSIFQRAGRLHRSGIKNNSSDCTCNDCLDNSETEYRAIVYDTTGEEEKIYPYATGDPDEFKLLVKSSEELEQFGLYTFEKSVQSTENVYKEIPTEYNYGTFNRESTDGRSYFKKREKRYQFRDTISRREDVLLGDAYSKLKEKKQSDDFTKFDVFKFYRKNSVPIPSWWIKSPDVELERLTIDVGSYTIPVYTNLKYTYNRGVHPPVEISEPIQDEDDGFL